MKPEIHTYENDSGEIELHIFVRTFASVEDADEWLDENNSAVVLLGRFEDGQRIH